MLIHLWQDQLRDAMMRKKASSLDKPDVLLTDEDMFPDGVPTPMCDTFVTGSHTRARRPRELRCTGQRVLSLLPLMLATHTIAQSLRSEQLAGVGLVTRQRKWGGVFLS